MPRWLKIVGVGCGGFVVLGIMLVVLVAVLSTNGATTNPSQGQKDELAEDQKQAGNDSQKAVKVGEPVDVGDVKWLVQDARQATELQSEFDETKQGNFVIVDFAFTNNGNEAVTLDSTSLALVDSEGRKSEADPDTLGYVEPNKDIFLEQVNPGVTKEGEVIYTVAPGASEFELEAGDADMFGGETARIELGF